jgi:hypothetical protein
MEYKELVVYVKGQQGENLTLTGRTKDERLTPKMARWALAVVGGIGTVGDVWDDEAGVGYSVYAKSARKHYA